MYKFDKQEMTQNKSIRLRTVEVLKLADGTERDGQYHSVVFTPDMNIQDIPCDVCKSIAQVIWTPQVIKDYKDSIKQIEQI